MKLYSELAEYYFDIENFSRKFNQEVTFLHDILKKHRIKTVLDIGCGSGEHVNALQSLGYEISGVDISEQMVITAKKRFPHCKFEEADLLRYQSKTKMDGIICMFGTFNYLIEEELVGNSIKRIYDNLKPAGIAVFDIWNAEPVLKIKRKPITPICTINSNGETVKRNRGFRITRTNIPVVEVNYIYNVDKTEVKDKHSMRIFHLQELKEKFESAKFELINIFGDFEQDRFRKNGSRILLVVKKRS